MQPKGISGRSVQCQINTVSWPFITILGFGELVANFFKDLFLLLL